MKAINRLVLAVLLVTTAMASVACPGKSKTSGGGDTTAAARDSMHTPPK